MQELLPGMEKREAEFKTLIYQSPTLTFADRLDIDLGNREVQVKHLGRGNISRRHSRLSAEGKNSSRWRPAGSSRSVHI